MVFFFFFFQAEDGIRDWSVTGVQTCALPIWAAAALSEADRPVPKAHLDAIDRIAPSLRTLRHSDGSLARFHGGGRGSEGRLDHALAASGVKSRAPDGLSMGFARLSAGRTSIIVDATEPRSEERRVGKECRSRWSPYH